MQFINILFAFIFSMIRFLRTEAFSVRQIDGNSTRRNAQIKGDLTKYFRFLLECIPVFRLANWQPVRVPKPRQLVRYRHHQARMQDDFFGR